MKGKHNGWKSDYATSSDKENGTKPVEKPFKPFVLGKLFGINRRSPIEDAPSLIGGVQRGKDEIKGG